MLGGPQTNQERHAGRGRRHGNPVSHKARSVEQGVAVGGHRLSVQVAPEVLGKVLGRGVAPLGR